MSNINNEELKGKAKKAFPFEVQEHKYQVVQLIPTKSSKIKSTDQFFNEVNKMFHKTISFSDKKIVYNQPYKLSFYIQVKAKNINFYMIYPCDFKNKLDLILTLNWKGLEIKELDNFPVDLNEFEQKQISYQNNDCLSINKDKRDKYLLSSIAYLNRSLNEDEEIGIFYNFLPTSDKESDYFQNSVYKKEIARYKDGEDLSKKKDFKNISIEIGKLSISFVEETINCLFNNPDKKCEVFKSVPKRPSGATRNKANTDLCKTQICAFVKSNNKSSTKKLFSEINKAFDIVSGDNKLAVDKKKIKTTDKNAVIYKPIIPEIDINRTSSTECNSFFNIPTREALNECKAITHNKCIELNIPECLLKGTRPIAYTKIDGKEKLVFYSSDDQISRSEVVIIGPKGSGKTYYSTLTAKNSIRAGRGVAIVEIIEDCPMCKSILEDKTIPKKDIINIDCRDYDSVQSLCFNEIEMWDNMEPRLKVDRAIQRGQQLQYFLDSINDESSSLKPRMIKYFFAACAVVYCVDVNASFNDIMECLTDPEIREEYINSLKEEDSKFLKTRIKTLRELTKDSGTNDNSKIDGILNREALFSSVSFQAEMISKKRANNNIDLKEALQDNKILLIQIPEQVFTNPSIRNTMATFFLSKIWNAKKQLSTNNDKQPTDLFFDEFYKCPTSMKIFEDIFSEGRKFNLTSVVTIHTLDELSYMCKKRLISGGASFIMMYGTNADDFKQLTPYLDESIEFEDLKELPRRHGICIIKNEDKDHSSFIGRFPKEFPIINNIDDNNINDNKS